MNKDEAKKIVEIELEKISNLPDGAGVAILDSKTIEKDWGWVFFYQSKAYIKSQDFRDMLGGNAPYIVNRNTGELLETGTAHDIDYYIKEYESKL